MSRQLALSSAVSVMVMMAFVLYGRSLPRHLGPVTPNALHLPQVSGFKALLPL